MQRAATSLIAGCASLCCLRGCCSAPLLDLRSHALLPHSIALSPLCTQGGNAYGQLGSGKSAPELSSSLVPGSVAGGHSFGSLAVSETHACGIESDTDSAWCWVRLQGDG